MEFGICFPSRPVSVEGNARTYRSRYPPDGEVVHKDFLSEVSRAVESRYVFHVSLTETLKRFAHLLFIGIIEMEGPPSTAKILCPGNSRSACMTVLTTPAWAHPVITTSRLPLSSIKRAWSSAMASRTSFPSFSRNALVPVHPTGANRFQEWDM